MITYNVSSTDRKLHRRITAETPAEAMKTFLGKRAATIKSAEWTADGKEWFFDAMVSTTNQPFRWNKDAARSIRGHVWID